MDFERLNRLLGYFFWVLADLFLGIGVSRLFLYPVAAYILGAEQFGIFVTALSVAALLGITPQMGLAIGLSRHLVEYPAEQRPRVCATAMRMCHRAMIIIIAVAFLGIGAAWASQRIPRALLACLAPLILSLYAENQATLLVAELSINRRFRTLAGWSGLRAGCGFAGGLAGALLWGSTGLACGIAAGNAAAYTVLRWCRREWMRAPGDPGAASLLRQVWFHISLASMLGFAGEYVPRLTLSVWGSFEAVSQLYGAVSTVALFLMGSTCCSIFMTHMLAAYKSRADLSASTRRLYILFSLGVIVGLSVLGQLAGPFLLKVMYPRFAESSRGLLAIANWAIPLASTAIMIRPLVVKFAPAKSIPVVNACMLAGQLIPCLILVPPYGAAGAAWGMVIGGATHALAMWLVPVMAARRGWGSQ
jgi:O-antigen/teichoic acid export membrane protein